MTDYKLVPVEPTPDMLEAGKHAMDAGCYASGIYADMLAAAPAVHGEPVSAQFRYRRPERSLPSRSAWSAWQPAKVDETRPTYHFDEQGWEVEYRLLYTTPQPAVQGEPVGRVKTVGGYPDESEHTIEWLCKYKELKDGDLLYTTPQSTEQQPELCRTQPCGCVICFCENETQCMGCGAKHCGTHPVGQFPAPAYQQPADQQPSPDVTQLVEALRRSFPLLDDEGLDEDEHHCEWSIQQERKRLHVILDAYRKGGES